MNFLAHLYLSGEDEEIRLGNFIGDFVKGNNYKHYPINVRKGIILHRKIDYFTDNHHLVRQHKSLFYKRYHKYSGIVIDIMYDHFLSTQWSKFSETDLDDFINAMYTWIEQITLQIPENMQKIVPFLIKNQWLRSYNTLEGLERVFIGMSKGTSLPAEHSYAIKIIKENYNTIEKDFVNYFNELIAYTEIQLKELHNY